MINEIDFQNEFGICNKVDPLPPYLCLASPNLFFFKKQKLQLQDW